ncbi:hypothetical protein AGLY_016602 [Aphis glycines]|uniref:Uncharacterized protein n=1 Tax=Aphis glycines TaxID=307491 RepID=A0A6G0SZ59_APHGL|nr:hypothetical protein AGLY_016602 [Aphis glycines]
MPVLTWNASKHSAIVNECIGINEMNKKNKSNESNEPNVSKVINLLEENDQTEKMNENNGSTPFLSATPDPPVSSNSSVDANTLVETLVKQNSMLMELLKLQQNITTIIKLPLIEIILLRVFFMFSHQNPNKNYIHQYYCQYSFEILHPPFSYFPSKRFHTTFLVVPSSGYSKVSKDLNGINKLFSFSISFNNFNLSSSSTVICGTFQTILFKTTFPEFVLALLEIESPSSLCSQ